MSQPNTEVTSKDVAALAARALRHPGSLTLAEIQTLAGSVLTQRPDREDDHESEPASP